MFCVFCVVVRCVVSRVCVLLVVSVVVCTSFAYACFLVYVCRGLLVVCLLDALRLLYAVCCCRCLFVFLVAVLCLMCSVSASACAELFICYLVLMAFCLPCAARFCFASWCVVVRRILKG